MIDAGPFLKAIELATQLLAAGFAAIFLQAAGHRQARAGRELRAAGHRTAELADQAIDGEGHANRQQAVAAAELLPTR